MDNSSKTLSTRRDFLRVGSLCPLGIGLAQLLHAQSEGAQEGKAQACILLWLEGGPAQMDTWDPKSNSGLKPIATKVSGIQISELLPRLAQQMNKLAVIRSIHTEETNHPQGTFQSLTAHRPNAAMKF